MTRPWLTIRVSLAACFPPFPISFLGTVSSISEKRLLSDMTAVQSGRCMAFSRLSAVYFCHWSDPFSLTLNTSCSVRCGKPRVGGVFVKLDLLVVRYTRAAWRGCSLSLVCAVNAFSR
ncbi:hypothetical protein BDV95DRAFT_202441 [Massariosphaeria phaeospora]|uniref:Uncharacterized protein n=1 Tax=Massariosphaeria phaeospora TaxID=100035 RepID=A0A7C8M3J4_9PLEO|nr:hypothetical protein BDV95DRAFT_202441 [Massariosphaeria phaeospora]